MLEELGIRAKEAEKELMVASTVEKNAALKSIADPEVSFRLFLCKIARNTSAR